MSKLFDDEDNMPGDELAVVRRCIMVYEDSDDHHDKASINQLIPLLLCHACYELIVLRGCA
jgi:hypothetical protein